MNNYFHIDNNLDVKQSSSLITKKNNKNIRKSNNFDLAKNMNLGYYLITPMIFGVFFGLFLDNQLKTKQIFFIIFFSLGVIGTFYNLYRIYKDD